MKRNLLYILLLTLAISILIVFWPLTPKSTSQQTLEASWLQFSREVAALAEQVNDAPTEGDSRTTAEGYRHMARLLSTSLSKFTDHDNPDFPNLVRFPNTVARIGWDNPDNVYYSAKLRGDHEYRIRGNLGTAVFTSFNVYTGLLGYTPMNKMRFVDGSNSNKMSFADNGDFEIILSAKPRAGNWIKLDQDADNIVIRQFFADWHDADSGSLEIVNLTTLGQGAQPLTEADVQRQLQESIKMVEGLRSALSTASRVLFSFKLDDNTVSKPRIPKNSSMGDPSHATSRGYFKIAEDEALVVSYPDSVCQFSNIQLVNPWLESLDYTNFQSHLNNALYLPDSDGMLRFVIAAEDPGVPNWLDTTGLLEGSMFMRWTQCESFPDKVQTEVVKLDQLREVLPADTPAVSVEQRQKAIAVRQIAMSRRYAGG